MARRNYTGLPFMKMAATAIDGPPVVLLVDDDPTALHLLNAILRHEGLETLNAANVRDAKATVARDTFDLAILDVQLPDGNGLDLCRWVKTQTSHADVPVLILSSDDDVRTKVAGFEAGATDYVTKPFHRAEVLARVKTQLKLFKAYRSMIELQAFKLAQLTSAQQAMLPQPERMPEAQFHLHYQPLQEAGGDLCQVFSVGKRIHDYIVADVCGHDIGSAMTTAALQALLAQNCSALYSPSEILKSINQVACSIVSEGQYITAVYARVNRQAKRLTLANAGHPPAVLQKSDGSVSVLQVDGDVIGAFEAAEFGILEVPVQAGDRIFLFSDSLVEVIGSRNESLNWTRGLDRIMHVCQTLAHSDLNAAVTDLARRVLDDVKAADDVTIIGIEV